MNCMFPMFGPITSLASSNTDQARGAELSIVSILDGQVGTPVTWLDQPSAGNRYMPADQHVMFQAVADDIRAHLPDGAVVMHGPGPTLELMRRILPTWRPTIVIDTRSFTRQTGLLPGRNLGASYPLTAFGADAAPNLGNTARRALATARLLLYTVSAPSAYCPIEQEGRHQRFH